jgi:hypothetical protein
MDAFEYLSVLISIILGLALTQLLTGAGRLIRNRRRVKFFFPAAVWMGVLFVVIVQSWWTMFTLRHYDGWTIDKFIVVLLHPAFLYFLVDLLAADADGAAEIDMQAEFLRQAPVFFAAFIGLLVSSFVRPLILFSQFTPPLDFTFHVMFGALCLTAVFLRSARFHWFAAPLAVLLVGVYVALISPYLR